MCPAMDSSTWDKEFGNLLITDCTLPLTKRREGRKKRKRKFHRAIQENPKTMKNKTIDYS
jgi:hypothetical protein